MTLPGAEFQPGPRRKRQWAQDEVRQVALRLFGLWAVETKRGTRPKLTPKRERAVGARLREGYSEAEIAQAIRGFAASAWHRGHNPRNARYDQLEWICKDGETIERGVGLFESRAPTPADYLRQEEREREEEEERRRARSAKLKASRERRGAMPPLKRVWEPDFDPDEIAEAVFGTSDEANDDR